MTQLHLTDDQLSGLVDGSIGETERALLKEHLHNCRSCYMAYEDALRYRAIWEVDPSVFRAPPAIAAIAHETPVRARRNAEQPAREHRRQRFAWGSWAPALTGAVAVIAVVAAIAIWRPEVLQPPRSEYSELFAPVRAAVEEASTGGSIVLPGTESVAGETVTAYRAGFVDADPAVTDALHDLAEAYRDDRTSPEVAHWLISGFLAVGQLENARLYVEDARRRYPGDQRFVILEAIVAYRGNDMQRAERLLQLALQRDPFNGVALLNLGLVQYEQGQWDMARRTLESVRSRFAGSPLEARAATLLSDLLGG
jgi:tetratricopeptide (TPR) repeat protein